MGMPLKEHVDILNQGTVAWNQWRKDNADIKPDLSEANLYEFDLISTNLNDANLLRANLRYADFNMANLRRADLRGADLYRANLMTADLIEADLTGANLMETDLYMADFSRANLSQVDLTSALLCGTELTEANFSKSILGETIFANIDLSVVKGLDRVKHTGPSTIGIDTLYRSNGNIPEVFLVGAGVPDGFIARVASLVAQHVPLCSCFISHSSKDQAFAKRLHADLQDNGVRCWFAPEDMKIGDKIRQAIDRSIRVHDKLLLVLSKHSITSEWVEKEVETAFEEERKRKKTVLFPVRIDSSVMDTDQAWATDIRNTRHIGDFTQWKDPHPYQGAFDRLLRDLKDEKMSVEVT